MTYNNGSSNKMHDTRLRSLEWTLADQLRSTHEGWNLVENDLGTQLRSVGFRFTGDVEAYKYVRGYAIMGSILHRKAIGRILLSSPLELVNLEALA